MLESVTQWTTFHLTQLEVTSAGVLVSALGVGGTVSAVIVALGTANRADARWERDRHDLQKARARLVTILSHEGTGTEDVSEVAIMNDGPESILLAGVADVQPRPASTRLEGTVQLGPGIEGLPVVGLIRPLGRAEFYVHCVDAEGNRVPWPKGRRLVTIEFMDAHGKAWRRLNLNEPEPIDRVTWPIRRK